MGEIVVGLILIAALGCALDYVNERAAVEGVWRSFGWPTASALVLLGFGVIFVWSICRIVTK